MIVVAIIGIWRPSRFLNSRTWSPNLKRVEPRRIWALSAPRFFHLLWRHGSWYPTAGAASLSSLSLGGRYLQAVPNSDLPKTTNNAGHASIATEVTPLATLVAGSTTILRVVRLGDASWSIALTRPAPVNSGRATRLACSTQQASPDVCGRLVFNASPHFYPFRLDVG